MKSKKEINVRELAIKIANRILYIAPGEEYISPIVSAIEHELLKAFHLAQRTTKRKGK